MKKEYIKPAMSVYSLTTKKILLVSGTLTGGSQNNPSMAPMLDDDFDSSSDFDEP
jgi:hypothetical protein